MCLCVCECECECECEYVCVCVCVHACVHFVHLVCPLVFVTIWCVYERLCEHERFELFHGNEIQRQINTVIIIIDYYYMLE